MVWEMFDRDGPGGFQICGVDGDVVDSAPIATLRVACEVTVEAESASPAVLEATERDLERVTDSLDGRIVATARTRSTLVTLVYLPSDDDADWYTRIALPLGAKISVASADDPDWTLFAKMRPEGIEEQSMLDYRVRTQLHKAGDVGGERTIDHVVTGLSTESLAAFEAAVAAMGYTVESSGGSVALRVNADPRHVTDDSWTIRLIAERHGGNYDGWGCEVVGGGRGAGRPRAKKRWWRR